MYRYKIHQCNRINMKQHEVIQSKKILRLKWNTNSQSRINLIMKRSEMKWSYMKTKLVDIAFLFLKYCDQSFNQIKYHSNEMNTAVKKFADFAVIISAPLTVC